MNIPKTINLLKIKLKQPFNPIQTMHNKFIFFLTIPKILLTYKKIFSMKIKFLIRVLTIKQMQAIKTLTRYLILETNKAVKEKKKKIKI
jgi:hypothetical protein